MFFFGWDELGAQFQRMFFPEISIFFTAIPEMPEIKDATIVCWYYTLSLYFYKLIQGTHESPPLEKGTFLQRPTVNIK